jgi:hypothetical protein
MLRNEFERILRSRIYAINEEMFQELLDELVVVAQSALDDLDYELGMGEDL